MILYPITITVTDNENNVLEDATVSVWDETFQYHKGSFNTTEDGTCIIGLNNGTYNVFVALDGYIPTASYQILTVSDSADEVTYVLYPIEEETIPAGKVILYGYLNTPAGDPVVGAAVLCRLPQLDQYGVETSYDKHDLTTVTNAVGYYKFLLNAGLKVTLVIPYGNLIKTGTLPLSGSIAGVDLDSQTINI